MRISSYYRPDGKATFGLEAGDEILDADDSFLATYPSLQAVLASGALGHLKEAASGFKKVDRKDVSFLPPIVRPGKIICIGLNYRAHVAETGREQPKYPSIFTRYPESLVGCDQPLIRPKASDKFDYEGELAVVIGTAGRAISAAQAMNHVAGYCCFNDGSIRDFQRHTSQFWAGKNFNQSGSMGPTLVTPEEIGDLAELTLETRLNGEVMQRTSVGDLLFDVPALIEYLSTVVELSPGDVIATGTPSGVGLFREPPVWMKPGDQVEVKISKVGTLANQIEQDR